MIFYYDAEHKRVYMPGGEGFIYVFQMKDPDHYQLLAKIPTALGDVPPVILVGRGRACTAFSWPFQLVQAKALKCGSIPFRTEPVTKAEVFGGVPRETKERCAADLACGRDPRGRVRDGSDPARIQRRRSAFTPSKQLCLAQSGI